MNQMMKAIVIDHPGAPDVMELREVPIPEIRPTDVLIKVESCGVCFHDVVTRNGVLRRGIKMPVIPGHEVSGIVHKVGPQVFNFKIGDRVCTTQRRHICGHCMYCKSSRETSCNDREFLGDLGLNGGYAQYVAVQQDNICHIPETVSFNQAAVTSCAIGTQLNAIRDVGKVKLGEKVLVTGSGGGLGIHGIQLAKLSGAHVIAVTTSAEKQKIIREHGANEVILIERGEDFSTSIKEITNGYGVDVVIDNVGSPTFDATRKSLAMGGRWIFVGQVTGEFVKLNPAQLFMRDISIMSAKSTSKKQLEDALSLVAQGLVKPVITGEMSLEKARQAHQEVESGHSTGRIVLKPNV
jgi:2-desacetyl-2-hydroxyethyl bacteriochlorophyllide A dehydrogenase